MNHWKNIQERVTALQDKADLEGADAGPHGDLACIVRDLAKEVATMARLMAERHEAEKAAVDY